MKIGDTIKVRHHCVTTNGKLAVVTKRHANPGRIKYFIAHLLDGSRSVCVSSDQGEVICK